MRINRSNPEPSGAQHSRRLLPRSSRPPAARSRVRSSRSPKKKSLKSVPSPRNTMRIRRTRRKSPAAVFQSAA